MTTEPPSGYGRKGAFVVEWLRDRIADGDLPPGAHLRQDRIAAELNASRVPVREAFKVLVSEGVIVHRPNQGHYVAEVSGEEMRQLVWLRDTAETHLAATAVLPAPSALAQMRVANQGLRGVLVDDPTAVARIARYDFAFHSALWDASPDRVIAGQATLMWQRIAPYRMFIGYDADILTRFVAEHDAIAGAVDSCDREALVEAVGAHQEFTQRTIQRVAEATRPRG